MCLDCGCEEGNSHKHHHHVLESDGHEHVHTHSHHEGNRHHVHHHTHDHIFEEAEGNGSRTIELSRKVLAKNDAIAQENRHWLTERDVMTINMISAPGSGKTLLLEKTLEELKKRVRCAVITGDLQTDNDAKRLEGKGANIHQIQTWHSCHLDAEQIQHALPQVIKQDEQLLFIENVGNMVCPVAFDLGESFKVALLSITEGEDKPIKYPTLFLDAQVTLLTKMDLAPHVDWDMDSFRQNIQRVHPGMVVFEVSAKTGLGMDAWLDYVEKLVKPLEVG